MSFATRCPACGTTFRIAATQLGAADGWVRCGRCGEAFDAGQALVAGEADDARAAGAGGSNTGDADAGRDAGNGAVRSAAGAGADADEVMTGQAVLRPDSASAPSGAPDDDNMLDGGVSAATYDDKVTTPPVVERASAVEGAAGDSDPADVRAVAVGLERASAAGSDEDAGTGIGDADTAATALPTSAIDLAASGRLVASPAADAAAGAFCDEPPDTVRPSALQASSAAETAPPAAAVDAQAAPPPAPAVAGSALPGLQAGLPRQAEPQAEREDLLFEAALPGPRIAASDTVPADLDLSSFAGTADDAGAARRQRGLQAALAAAVLLLALALALQAAWHWRDLIAAAWLPSRPTLDALCRAAGCRIEPLRRLDGVAVESSALTAAPSGRAVQLALVLRNRSRLPVALPWVELALTEVNGGLMARRALSPADLGATSATIAPSAEATLRATLAFDGRPPSGYTVELFQP